MSDPHRPRRPGLPDSFRARRTAAFSIIDVMMSLMITSIAIAVVIPRLTSTKRQARATAIMNDFRTFGAAFDHYAQERGTFPAEVAAGVLPAEMADRIHPVAWQRETPIGGQYNWENDQLHYGVRYKAAIAVNGTSTAALALDVDMLEAIDRMMDDGNLNAGSFRLGAGNEPIFILAR